MRGTSYFCAVILLLVPFSGAHAQNQAPQIRQSDLPKTPIAVGALRITVTEFKGSASILIHTGEIKLLVENTSDAFVTFSPSKLMLVGKAGDQTAILGIRELEDLSASAAYGYLPAMDRDLPPNTHINLAYRLTDRVAIPVQLFYDRHVVAGITK